MKSQNNSLSSALTEFGGGIAGGFSSSMDKVIKTTTRVAIDEFKEGAKTAEKQVLLLEKELSANEEVELGTPHATEAQAVSERPSRTSAEHQAYLRDVLQSSEKGEREDQIQLRTQIEEIRVEIGKLKDASSEMDEVFKEISTQSVPEKPGKYHLNFYEWVLISITNARKKMEEVNTLGQMFASRKREKQYMAMAKKHGTSFTMNNERAITRQTG